MLSNNTNTDENIQLGYLIILVFIPVVFVCITLRLCLEARSQTIHIRNYEQL